jgi:hypothetical protein
MAAVGEKPMAVDTVGTARLGSTHLSLVTDDIATALERLEAFGGRRVTHPVTGSSHA